MIKACEVNDPAKCRGPERPLREHRILNLGLLFLVVPVQHQDGHIGGHGQFEFRLRQGSSSLDFRGNQIGVLQVDGARKWKTGVLQLDKPCFSDGGDLADNRSLAVREIRLVRTTENPVPDHHQHQQTAPLPKIAAAPASA